MGAGLRHLGGVGVDVDAFEEEKLLIISERDYEIRNTIWRLFKSSALRGDRDGGIPQKQAKSLLLTGFVQR